MPPYLSACVHVRVHVDVRVHARARVRAYVHACAPVRAHVHDFSYVPNARSSHVSRLPPRRPPGRGAHSARLLQAQTTIAKPRPSRLHDATHAPRAPHAGGARPQISPRLQPRPLTGPDWDHWRDAGDE